MEAKNNQKNAKKCEKTQKNRTFLTKNSNFSLEEGERLEDLQCNNLKIIQNKNLYCFTSDSVILANTICTKPKDVVVEIGAGCGVISILVQAKNALQKIIAFEVQPQMAALASKNVLLNNLQNIEVVCDDIKNYEKHIAKGKANVVFCNPPYFKPTKFEQTGCNKIAKEEVLLNMDDLCRYASEILKDGGSFYVCEPAERCSELVCTLQKYALATKEIFFTENGKGQVKTVFVKAVKGGKFGTKVKPNLITNDPNGDYLETLHTKNFLR